MEGGQSKALISPQAAARCGWNGDSGVLAALSGGPDSVALLHGLRELSAQGGIGSLAAAHVHHGIRGEAADRDEAFCRELCQSWRIPLLVFHGDAPALAKETGRSLETAAREMRYRFLEQAREELRCQTIALAHHRDDQAETVLMHLMRGAGLTGLCGMRYRSGLLARPLLGVSRREILTYLAENGLAYCTDETNALGNAVRNRVRLELLPLMRSFQPEAEAAIAGAAELIQQDEELLNRLSGQLLTRCQGPDGGLDRETLLSAEKPLTGRLLRGRLYGAMGDVTRRDVERVEALLSAQAGTCIQLREGLSAWVDAKKLFIGLYPGQAVYCVPFTAEGTTHTPRGRFVSEITDGFRPPVGRNEAYLDLDKLPERLTARSRMEGDRFHPLGAPGDRKLADYLTDRKIPLTLRDMPLLASEQRIWFVPGGTVAHEARITPETVRILHIIYEEDT